MSDIWFIFNNNGEFLFNTTEITRTNLSLIPSRFNARYIVKNPDGYNSEISQNISYDLSTKKVIFTTRQPEDTIDAEVVDYGEIVTELTKAKNDIETLKENFNTEITRINELYNLLSLQKQVIDNNNTIITQQQTQINALETLTQSQKTDIETLSNLILTNITNIETLTEKQNTDAETLSNLILSNKTNIENLQILSTTQQEEINNNTNILNTEKNMLDIVLTNVKILTN
jgi:hypothetical protein